MKVEIKLEDPEFCDGCPLLIDCEVAGMGQFCKFMHLELKEDCDNWTVKRPKLCIDKHGK